MTILDANLLLYAYNSDAPQQEMAAAWLRKLPQSRETIALPWVTIWAFIRISTNSRIWPNPRPAKDAFAIVGGWLGAAGRRSVAPGTTPRRNSGKTCQRPRCNRCAGNGRRSCRAGD